MKFGVESSFIFAKLVRWTRSSCVVIMLGKLTNSCCIELETAQINSEVGFLGMGRVLKE